MKNLLEVDELSVQFKTPFGLIDAIKKISFSIKQGEIVGIVGESGSGKTITAQSIIGLQPKEAKVSGKIMLEDENLLEKTAKEMESIRGKKIGMIFQDPTAALNPTMKIGFQVMEGLMKHKGLSRSHAYHEAIDLLNQVGISETEKRMQQYPHELSGGMKQRILIAIAIACNPTLLIADEITTALDVTIQAQILDLLKSLHKTKNLTLLIISHDLGVIANMCDRVLVMLSGGIVEEGSVEKIFKEPTHPYTKKLLNAKNSYLMEAEVFV